MRCTRTNADTAWRDRTALGPAVCRMWQSALCPVVLQQIVRQHRSALMRDAHRIAKGSRAHFASYAEALAYGLRAAWLSARSRREIRSLAMQAGRPNVPFTAAQIEASRFATRRCGASFYAS